MSKNNPVWPKVKRTAIAGLNNFREYLGKIVIIVSGAAIGGNSVYSIFFTDLMSVKHPSGWQIVNGLIGILVSGFLFIGIALYFFLKVIPFIWSGFKIHHLKI